MPKILQEIVECVRNSIVSLGKWRRQIKALKVSENGQQTTKTWREIPELQTAPSTRHDIE
jgi:hypothetical protein